MSTQLYAKPIRIFHSVFALLMLMQLAVGNLMEVPEVEEEHHTSLQLVTPMIAHDNGMAHTHGLNIVAEAHAHESHKATAGAGEEEEPLSFEIHELLGITLAVLVLIRILLAMTSLPGASWRDLFPWLSADGRQQWLSEAKAQLSGWMKGKLAAPEEGETVARSVHGLILLASTVMAVTGMLLYVGWSTTEPQMMWVELVAEVHEIVVLGLEILIAGHILAVIMHQRQGHNILDRISPRS